MRPPSGDWLDRRERAEVHWKRRPTSLTCSVHDALDSLMIWAAHEGTLQKLICAPIGNCPTLALVFRPVLIRMVRMRNVQKIKSAFGRLFAED
jgi:hypothetical protein